MLFRSKKKAKSGEARKVTKPYSGSEGEEGMSDQATDFRGSQGTGTVSDSSNEYHGSTQSNDIDKVEEKIVSSDSDSKRELVREPGREYESSVSGDDDNDSVGVDNESEYNRESSDAVVNDDDDDESVSNDNDGHISNDNDGSLVDDDDDDGDDDDDDDNCVDNDLSDSVRIQSEEEADDEKAEIENQERSDGDYEEEQCEDEGKNDELELEIDDDFCHQEGDSKERKSTEEQNVIDCAVEEGKGYSQSEISEAIKDTCKEKVILENAENEKCKTIDPATGPCVKPNVEESDITVDNRHFDDVNGDNRTRSSYFVCDNNSQSEKVDHVLEGAKMT